jgi:hypothetical protein
VTVFSLAPSSDRRGSDDQRGFTFAKPRFGQHTLGIGAGLVAE